MAQRPPERSHKAQLIDEIESSRKALGSDLRAISQSVDLPLRIGRHLRSTPVRVAVGSAIVGLLGSLLFGRSGRKLRAAARASGLWRPIAKKAMDFYRQQADLPTKDANSVNFSTIASAVWRALK
jgi:hypothetical protein